MDDLSKVDIDVRILIALFGLTLEKADGGKLKEAYFTAHDIYCWLGRRPVFGESTDRFIQKKLSKMRDQVKDIFDGSGNHCKRVNVLAWYLEKRETYRYKIPDNAAENQFSAALIIRLDESRRTNAAISPEDEERIVGEIYEEFKSDPAYELSGPEEVRQKVADAVEPGFYFTRDIKNLLRPTSRLHAERTFLELLSKPLPAATREFSGETRKKPKT